MTSPSLWQAVLAGLAAKGWKTHRAVLILCERGYGQDGAILCRSLFNLVVILFWIKKDPEERARRYIDYDWVLRQKADDAIKKFAQTEDPRLSHEELAELQEQIDKESARAKEDHGYDRVGWSGKSILEMAKEVSLEPAYRMGYAMMSSYEHSDARSLRWYAGQDEQGIFLKLEPGRELMRAVLGSTYSLLLDIGKVANQELELGISEDLEKAEENRALFRRVPQKS